MLANALQVAELTFLLLQHTAPQHREYLSWDGVGSGTPSQRQQQYTQMRAAKAAERVLQHRIRGLEHTGDALAVQDRRRANKTKTRWVDICG